jgi:hypothetical protein
VDAFDVLFQVDPFHGLDAQGMVFFAECTAIRGHYWNKRWVAACFSWDLMRRIGRLTIICNGVIFGRHREYIKFLGLLVPVFSQSCSADQGILNGLVYAGRLADAGVAFQVVEPGLVLHMALCPARRAGYDIVTERGVRVAIVHQFNRVAWAVAQVYGRCPAANSSMVVTKIGVV